MKKSVEAVAYVATVIAGLLGLYFKIEYSGWVLLVGLLGVVSL